MLGDRVAVVGAGMVGSCVAAVLSRFPAARVELIDSDPARARTAEALGVDFALPEDATRGCDLVVHASASQAGLTTSLELLAPDGEVVELSWYGEKKISVPLGESFHSRRLAIRSSQVGSLAAREAGQPHLRRPHGARARTARRSRPRNAGHRQVRVRRTARGDAPHRRR